MSTLKKPDLTDTKLRAKLAKGMGHNYYGEPAWPNDLLYIFPVVILGTIACVVGLAVLDPAFLGDKANPFATPLEILPEWYLYPVFQILRVVPNKLLGIALQTLIPLGLMILPFIENINERYYVIRIDSENDYIRLTINQSKTYFTPINKDTREEFKLLFERLVDISNLTTKVVSVNSREIEFTNCSANVAYCTFEFICNTNLAHEDYARIAKEFRLIFIENVPKMTTDYSDQCRRFISLIDMLYDNQCSVVLLAESPIASICQINNLSKEFERTASRLYEMTIVQSV